MFYFDYINNKKILRSDFLQEVNAFFTTKDICICDKSDKNNPDISANKEIISNYLKINTEDLISPEQTHSANIKITKNNFSDYSDTDALILTSFQKAIFLNFADCTPIIFYDKKQNIGAITHAGWRGTAQKISAKTAEKLRKDFNVNYEDLVVLIGPAICLDCYSVGEEVFEKLKSTVDDFSGLYKEKNNNRYVDLKNINKKQLTELGINNIDICPYCTCCDNQYFYSYRKENGTLLRHSAVLCLENYEEK